jgi:hypothetical protein
MDVDSSGDTRRERMPTDNIEALFLKLEGLPTLIQNSKQDMRAWKQLLSTRVRKICIFSKDLHFVRSNCVCVIT